MASLHLTNGSNSVSGTVTVACKMPNGLVLRIYRPIERDQPVMGGGVQKETIHIEYGKRYFIRGVAYPFGEQPRGVITDSGYALTPNIPEDFWDEWLRQHAETELVQNNLIFAHSRQVDVEAIAKEYEKQKSGLEPIDPQNLPREVKKYDPRDFA